MFRKSNAISDPHAVYLDVLQIDETGRLVIPQDVLHRMGWTEGQRLDLELDADGRLALHQVLEH